MPYSSSARVQLHIGRDFTPAQEAECSLLLDAADAWINTRAGRSWGITTPVTELHSSTGSTLYLRHVPVASITSITIRSALVGSAPTTLLAATGYELLDAARGLVRLYPAYYGWIATVVYTPDIPVDGRIELAATKLVAFWMGTLLSGQSDSSIQSYSIGQELQVRYKDGSAAATGGVPADISALIDNAAGHPGLVFA